MLDPEEAPPLGTVIDGRFTLNRFLGAGGMGAVYEAKSHSGESFALKLVLGTTLAGSPEAIERFGRETQLRIDSPNVVGALEAGVDSATGVPFMVMPLLVGMDLEALVEREGPLHPTLAVRVVRQACAGVSAAHRAGIIHRDIKPANLFLDHAPSGDVHVRVVDFGVAKLTSASTSLTATGRVLGTPFYMAPEQLLDAKRAGVAADVWSLGVTLYHALTGDVPFEGRGLADVMANIARGNVRPIQDLAPWVDQGLARIVHGALLASVDARCPTVDELARALEPHAHGPDDLSSAALEAHWSEDLAEARRADLPAKWSEVVDVRLAPTLELQLPEADRDPLVGATLAHKYRLLRCLGEGAMGVVYEASDPHGARFAVKVIRPELAGTSASARRRFVREAQVLQSLDSPHVVKVHAVETDTERQLPFIVMELYIGTDLERVCKQHGALEPTFVARLFCQAARGLAAAHARGIVHRDVKPANIFLSRQPSGELVAKICDFGVATQLAVPGAQAKLTRTGGMIGSPMYMAPEQAAGTDVGPRADIWSLGATMFEVLAGTPPWQVGESVPALMIALTNGTIPRLRERAPWVPSGIAEIVDRTMQRAPADRFSDAEQLERELQVFTAGSTKLDARDVRPAAGRVSIGEREQATTLGGETRALRPGATIAMQDAAVATALGTLVPSASAVPLSATQTTVEAIRRPRSPGGIVPLLTGIGVALVGVLIVSRFTGSSATSEPSNAGAAASSRAGADSRSGAASAAATSSEPTSAPDQQADPVSAVPAGTTAIPSTVASTSATHPPYVRPRPPATSIRPKPSATGLKPYFKP